MCVCVFIKLPESNFLFLKIPLKANTTINIFDHMKSPE